MVGEQSAPFKHGRADERGKVKQSLDQCLGCYWGDPTNVIPVSAATLSACSSHPDPGQRLSALRRKGIVESQPAEEEGVPRRLYTPTKTEAAHDYVAALPKTPCKKPETNPLAKVKRFELTQVRTPGTTTPEQLAAANADAEQFFLHATGKTEKLISRRNMLGCLACHLLDETNGQVAVADISVCTGRSISAVRSMLSALQAAEVLKLAGIKVGPRRHNTYGLTESDQAREFAELLTPPEICDFKTDQQLRTEESTAAAPMQPSVTTQPQEAPGLYNGNEYEQ